MPLDIVGAYLLLGIRGTGIDGRDDSVVRALAAQEEDLGLVASSHMVTNKHPQL